MSDRSESLDTLMQVLDSDSITSLDDRIIKADNSECINKLRNIKNSGDDSEELFPDFQKLSNMNRRDMKE
ncbi:MAG TPA: hypothetical protein PK293_16395 [Spirochaetota bacterium]|nr:hypothetical protein [Spirochaetota bacterium]